MGGATESLCLNIPKKSAVQTAHAGSVEEHQLGQTKLEDDRATHVACPVVCPGAGVRGKGIGHRNCKHMCTVRAL